MTLRLLTFGVVMLTLYVAFGDFLTASTLSTPQGFVSDVKSGIGDAVSRVISSVTALFRR